MPLTRSEKEKDYRNVKMKKADYDRLNSMKEYYIMNNNKTSNILLEKNSLDDDLNAINYQENQYLSEERKALCNDIVIAPSETITKPVITKLSLQEVVSLIEAKTGIHARQSGQGYTLRCPAHNDRNPSLSVSIGSDQTILMKCFRGCSFEAICSSLGLNPSALFPPTTYGNKSIPQKRIEYPYRNEQGIVLYWKVRIEEGFGDSSKRFFCERRDLNGQIIKNLNGCTKILYRLPELLQAIQEGLIIFLVEGEKDVETLFGKGLIASTTHATSFWCNEFTTILKDANVVILYDMDETGIKRRDMLCTILVGKVKKLRVVDLPGLEYSQSHGKDVSDWLANGNTISQLLDLVDKAPDHVASPLPNSNNIQQVQPSKICVVSMEELLNKPIPPREMLLSPFLPTQGLVMLYAIRGVGKTHAALGIAYAVASGSRFLKWEAPLARKVLYIDGEMPAFVMQERLRKIYEVSSVKPPAPDYFRLVTPDLQADVVPDLSIEAGRKRINEIINDSDLIIVDNVSTLFRCGNENEAESWQDAQAWALGQRKQGKSVLFVHHAGKTGNQRGTSKREDILDSVIKLERPNNYSPEQGAYFEVHFEKARGFIGEDAASFTAHLKEQEDGTWKWEVDGLMESGNGMDEEVLQVSELKKQGLTIAEIKRKTNLTKSQIETRITKAKKQRLIME